MIKTAIKHYIVESIINNIIKEPDTLGLIDTFLIQFDRTWSGKRTAPETRIYMFLPNAIISSEVKEYPSTIELDRSPAYAMIRTKEYGKTNRETLIKHIYNSKTVTNGSLKILRHMKLNIPPKLNSLALFNINRELADFNINRELADLAMETFRVALRKMGKDA